LIKCDICGEFTEVYFIAPNEEIVCASHSCCYQWFDDERGRHYDKSETGKTHEEIRSIRLSRLCDEIRSFGIKVEKILSADDKILSLGIPEGSFWIQWDDHFFIEEEMIFSMGTKSPIFTFDDVYEFLSYHRGEISCNARNTIFKFHLKG